MSGKNVFYLSEFGEQLRSRLTFSYFICCHCCCSGTKLYPTLWDAMDCSTLGSSVLHYLLEFAQIQVHESMMLSAYLILCHPLLLPSVFPSIRVFSSELALCIRWPKYWSFSFSISPSNENSELISFRINWCDLLAVQETLKSLLQHHKFKNITCLAVSLLYGPTLTSVHDYWKNQSFNYTNLWWQSDIAVF